MITGASGRRPPLRSHRGFPMRIKTAIRRAVSVLIFITPNDHPTSLFLPASKDTVRELIHLGWDGDKAHVDSPFDESHKVATWDLDARRTLIIYFAC